ncbi:GIY-YIG nuclease family protein [Imperialibacter roseus]|uniref:GIY-YIG nuclease family protein n=1 Tax=Imperialibacter roseus TaxID=1324217 RepID=UPI00374E663B
MEGFYFTYVLRSEKDNQNYTGYTHDLPSRLEAHHAGEVDSTKHRRPAVGIIGTSEHPTRSLEL